MYIFWTKEGKIKTFHRYQIPWEDLHSPDEETPALIWSDGRKEWFFEGKLHRLSGPARIWFDNKWFYLKGKFYGFKDWIYKHPNLDLYLEANGYKTEAQKALWKLKNL